MGIPITADTIKSSYLGTLESSHTLLEAVTDHIFKMEQLVGEDYVRGTLNRYRVLETHLKVFIRLKYGVADMLRFKYLVSFYKTTSGTLKQAIFKCGEEIFPLVL
jgi:hypothetical protein